MTGNKVPLLLVLSCASLAAAEAPSASKVFDRELSNTEKEVVSLVEAMPPDKFAFAPTNGEFKGVRTFAQQAKHIAYELHVIATGMLEETEAPITAAGENGPDSVRSKEDIVKYLKEAFAHAHQAIATLTNENIMQETPDPFNPKANRARASSASVMLWHTFDHYGQMVVYARMNSVVPPASR
jgi:uncharacterized damage-inducible protein DinB